MAVYVKKKRIEITHLYFKNNKGCSNKMHGSLNVKNIHDFILAGLIHLIVLTAEAKLTLFVMFC